MAANTPTGDRVEMSELALPESTVPRRWWVWLLILPLAAAAYWRFAASDAKSPAPTAAASRPVPVLTAVARHSDVPVYLTGLGSVTAFNTVTVKSRVDGQVTRIAFQEGQFVHQGDLLVEIDPRPFEVQLTQAEGQMARDLAQLKVAQLSLERYRELLARDFVSKQQVDDQAAQVLQYEGALKVNKGLIDSAKLQLSYSRITAPISGRIGLRLVDAGNMVHASDQTGLLVITQVQPIAVLFTLPEDAVPPVLAKLAAGERLPVEAYDRAGQTKIATGSLLTVDNQIDASTGTTRLKAVFDNDDSRLFPNQFVNVRLQIEVRQGAVVVPSAAVQRGPRGTFVYVVKADHSIELREIDIGPTSGGDAIVTSGLAVNEQVVTDGVDKLRAGSRVEARTPEPRAAAAKPGA